MSNKVLNNKGLELLRAEVKSGIKLDIIPFEELCSRYELQLVDWMDSLPTPVDLRLPVDGDYFDAENSKLIFDNYSSLTPAMASEELLWVTLAFRDYRIYASKRWTGASVNNLINHWFAPSARDRWRDQAISRLWWAGWYANQFHSVLAENVLDTLYCNSDFIASFMGRPTTSSNIPVAEVIITLAHKHYVEATDGKYDRDKFRNFLKEVDLVGGRQQLAVLSDEARTEIITEIWDTVHK